MNYKNCPRCKKGSIERKFDVRETEFTGKGLFAKEYIPKGEYIIQYKGKINKEKPKDHEQNLFLAQITYPKEKRIETFYIDPKNSKCMAKFCNHSCRYMNLNKFDAIRMIEFDFQIKFYFWIQYFFY